MQVTKRTIRVTCPDCEEIISLETAPQMRQRIACPHCWADLEVVELEPLQLDWYAPDDFEDDSD